MSEVAPRRVVHVAAGILLRPDRTFLLASRPDGKPMAGYWEFPGGKIEPGESPLGALGRELHEELGVTVETAYPWLTQTFEYTHARVQLHFFQVTAWRGEPVAHEGQHFAWQRVDAVEVSPVLPANAPILKWLHLPPRIVLDDGGARWEGMRAAWSDASPSADWRVARIDTPEQLAALAESCDLAVIDAARLAEPGWKATLALGPVRPVYVIDGPERAPDDLRALGAAGLADWA